MAAETLPSWNLSKVDNAWHWGQAGMDGAEHEEEWGMQARVSVLLIAPFAFKEIKLFLVRADCW